MRTAALSLQIAELAVRWRDEGVCGFDIAGAEAGYPPTRHLDAFQYVMRENFHITIHAGEAFGLPSIWEALQFCGAERLGHGVRIVDDIVADITVDGGTPKLGRLASYVRDLRVPLEMCPSSNVHSGAARSIEEHPIGLLSELRFRVTVNTDNRLMSHITMSQEFAKLVDAFGWGWNEIRWATINGMKSAFLPVRPALAPHQRGHQALVRGQRTVLRRARCACVTRGDIHTHVTFVTRGRKWPFVVTSGCLAFVVLGDPARVPRISRSDHR